MIEVNNAVVVINWVHGAEGVHGRITKLDQHNGVVWSIPGITPVHNLSSEYVVHPALGIHASRDKGRDRQPHNKNKKTNCIKKRRRAGGS